MTSEQTAELKRLLEAVRGDDKRCGCLACRDVALALRDTAPTQHSKEKS